MTSFSAQLLLQYTFRGFRIVTSRKGRDVGQGVLNLNRVGRDIKFFLAVDHLLIIAKTNLIDFDTNYGRLNR